MCSVVWLTWNWNIWDTFYVKGSGTTIKTERDILKLEDWHDFPLFQHHVLWPMAWSHVLSPRYHTIEWAWELVCLASVPAVWLWVSDLKNCASVSSPVKWDSWWYFLHGLVRIEVIMHVVGKRLAPNIQSPPLRWLHLLLEDGWIDRWIDTCPLFQ